MYGLGPMYKSDIYYVRVLKSCVWYEIGKCAMRNDFSYYSKL